MCLSRSSPTPCSPAIPPPGRSCSTAGSRRPWSSRAADLGGALWTARLLGEEPERIAAAHRAYFRAGAQVATTASYQASVEGLVAAGYDAAEARRLITPSVTLAREVRDELADTQPGAAGRRLGRTVRRVPGRRLGVPRPLRRLRRAAA